MTAQIHDSFIFKDQEYSIVGVNGQGLFDPVQYGLNPLGLCSACWRGYLCQYSLKENLLHLNWLRINIGSSNSNNSDVKEWPVINGVHPTKPPEDYPIFDSIYQNLNLPIKFSGGILLGNGFISELYVHMGFHPAWKFQTVHELIFKKGTVQEIREVSQRVAEIRKKMLTNSPAWEVNADSHQLEEWIRSTFQLDYQL
jgi:hypothetical protein